MCVYAFIKKTIQDRRKDGSQDYSQDPNGLGVDLLRAGKYQEAGKPDHPRDDAHDKGNKHADADLLHDIPFNLPIFETLLSSALLISRGLYIFILVFHDQYSRIRD